MEETRGQIDRLQQAFQALDANARGKTCHAMEGLVDEAREMIDEGLAPEVLDAALISAAQKVEHYEIASYGTLVAYAEACGAHDVVDLLRQTLEEEKAIRRRRHRPLPGRGVKMAVTTTTTAAAVATILPPRWPPRQQWRRQ